MTRSVMKSRVYLREKHKAIALLIFIDAILCPDKRKLDRGDIISIQNNNFKYTCKNFVIKMTVSYRSHVTRLYQNNETNEEMEV